MYVLTVDFTVHPAHVEAFLALAMENARQSLDEPACRQFDVCRDPARPGAVFLYEVYDDEAGFRAHLASPHFQTFDLAVRDMITDKHVRVLERCVD